MVLVDGQLGRYSNGMPATHSAAGSTRGRSKGRTVSAVMESVEMQEDFTEETFQKL
jgi:hypothetical protein